MLTPTVIAPGPTNALDAWEAKNDRDRRRTLGAIWTPEGLAAWMAQWVTAHGPGELLDPAAGGGALLAACPTPTARVACEREASLHDALVERIPGLELHGDFWDLDPSRRFHAITMNPPYIRASQIENRAAIHAHIRALGGPKLPMGTNLAVLFFMGCWLRLAPGGRLICLMPTQFLQSPGAIPVRRYLLEACAATAIVDLDDTGLFGADVRTTACLVLAERRADPPRELTFARHPGVSPFPAWDTFLRTAKTLAHADIDVEFMWRPDCRRRTATRPTQLLDAIAEVRSGTSTGADNFFLISHTEAAAARIEDAVMYCIPHLNDLPGRWAVPEQAPDASCATDKRVWLVDIGTEPTSAQRVYLDGGKAQELHETATARSRQQWWRQRNLGACDLMIGALRRNDYRVRVKVDAKGTPRPIDWASMSHRIRLRDEFRDLAGVLTAWLISDQGQRALRELEHHAGAGLYVLRTRALRQVSVPRLQDATPSWRADVERRLAALMRADVADDELGRARALRQINELMKMLDPYVDAARPGVARPSCRSLARGIRAERRAPSHDVHVGKRFVRSRSWRACSVCPARTAAMHAPPTSSGRALRCRQADPLTPSTTNPAASGTFDPASTSISGPCSAAWRIKRRTEGVASAYPTRRQSARSAIRDEASVSQASGSRSADHSARSCTRDPLRMTGLSGSEAGSDTPHRTGSTAIPAAFPRGMLRTAFLAYRTRAVDRRHAIAASTTVSHTPSDSSSQGLSSARARVPPTVRQRVNGRADARGKATILERDPGQCGSVRRALGA